MAEILEAIGEQLAEHEAACLALREQLLAEIAALIESCVEAIEKQRKILLFGNGGSAADSQHIATEFTVRFGKDRKALPAIALTTDTSALTAIGNDFGFEELFARQVEALCSLGDVVIGISTSGNSENVLRGLQAAKRIGAFTVGLGGKDGGKMRKIVDLPIIVPSPVTARIQEMHILIGHILVGTVEKELGLV